MAKKRKNPIRQLNADEYSRVSFDLEEDAQDLFLKYLDGHPLDIKDDHEAKPQVDHSKKQNAKKSNKQIDLHGKNLAEAIAAVDAEIREILFSADNVKKLKVITGKGLHSGSEGSILAKEIHSHILRTYRKKIIRIDESPADLLINGLPIRGHFYVQFR